MNWTSDNPHLSGNFAPVFDELDVPDLPVLSGSIPEDLSGAYMRNGPNPMFKPMSYTYPFDGDGMIHAIYLGNGKARYRNRFVQTRGLIAEERAGRAVYGGTMQPVPVDPALVGPNGEPGPYKNGAFVGVVSHADKILALLETTPGYELTEELETLGEWCPGTEEPIEIGAHTRRHPKTGSLFGVTYGVDEAFVRFQEIDAANQLVNSVKLPLVEPTMIHDFVLTDRHIVVLAGPAVFDMAAAEAGQLPVQWRPRLGTRIGLVPLDGEPVKWLETDPFFVFHFANGFEAKGKVVIDYVRHQRLHFGAEDGPSIPPKLHRMMIDTAASRITDSAVSDYAVEFPRVDDRRIATPTRYIYLPTLTGGWTRDRSTSATFNAIAAMDPESGDAVLHDFGNRLVGEPVFIPRPGHPGEQEGYLAVYIYDPAEDASTFVLLDAANVAAEPKVVIGLPRRVPQGLHGAWMPKG
ncbi:MAG: carotenoid oxygenase family protein [Pseudomonadota bacterium]